MNIPLLILNDNIAVSLLHLESLIMDLSALGYDAVSISMCCNMCLLCFLVFFSPFPAAQTNPRVICHAH